MPSVTMTALKSFKNRKKDDEFEVSERDAKLLETFRFAKRKSLVTRDMVQSESGDGERTKRRYKRRDMTAE
jgi:hypothetical protein